MSYTLENISFLATPVQFKYYFSPDPEGKVVLSQYPNGILKDGEQFTLSESIVSQFPVYLIIKDQSGNVVSVRDSSNLAISAIPVLPTSKAFSGIKSAAITPVSLNQEANHGTPFWLWLILIALIVYLLWKK